MSKLICLIIQQKQIFEKCRSRLAAKADLVSLKAEVDKLDIAKVLPVLVDLSKLSDVVKLCC